LAILIWADCVLCEVRAEIEKKKHLSIEYPPRSTASVRYLETERYRI